jgi:hypothetical protein
MPREQDGEGEDSIHVVLTRIDINLENAIKTFMAHEVRNEQDFKNIYNELRTVKSDIGKLNNAYCIAVGIIIAIEFVFKLIR